MSTAWRGVAVTALAVALLAGASVPPAAAFDEQAVANFYKDKRIKIVVGYAPGGGYDAVARLVARHISRFLPGSPSIIVENQPGAGSLVAANALYSSEAKDGSVFGTFTPGLIMQQLMGEKRVLFDARKFNWIGSGEDSYTACVVRTDSGVADMQDAMKGKPLALATQAPGSASYDLPILLNAVLGTKFKPITGYGSVPEMFLAVQNNEASGICIGYVSVILARIPHLLEGPNPVLKPILVSGDSTPDGPHLKGVPALETLAKNEEGRLLLRTLGLTSHITFAFAMPPEVPQDRVEAMRLAFEKTVKDAEFLKDAERARQRIAPYSGAKVAQFVDELMSVPPAVIAKLDAILKH